MIPWWGKIAAKMVLSRVPGGSGVLHRLGVYRHGAMDRPDYAYHVFMRHVSQAGIDPARPGIVCVELGPGDSLFTAVIAKALGWRAALVDVDRFATDDVAKYRAMAAHLRDVGLDAPDLANAGSLADVLARTGASYHPAGLDGLRGIADASVDFVFSQAVLEHVRKRDVAATFREMRRILKADGVCSHRIDFRDHLGGRLDNLRFRDAVWEHDFVARSGFYTNRIGFAEMLDLFREAGFAAEAHRTDRWESLPTSRRAMAAPFRSRSDPDLLISGADIVLRPSPP